MQHECQSHRTHVCLLLLGFANSLFVLKYSMRAGLPGIPVALLYFLLFLVTSMILVSPSGERFNRVWRSRTLLLVGMTFIALYAMAVVMIVPEANRVGRLPGIQDWLGRLFHGVFPYHAPQGASGFPVLFALALIPHLLGNLGFLEVAGIAAFLVAVLLSSRGDNRTAWLQFLLLASMPLLHYELVVRSELFFNMSLVLLVLVAGGDRVAERSSLKGMLLWGMVLGLLLSTRSAAGLLLCLYGIMLCKRQPRKGLIVVCAAGVTFLVTLLPFLVWNAPLFVSQGPFAFQQQLVAFPLWLEGVVVIVVIVAGWRAATLAEVEFYGGLLLFLVTALSFAMGIWEYGLVGGIVGDHFDLAYFVFSVPFLLISVRPAKQHPA